MANILVAFLTGALTLGGTLFALKEPPCTANDAALKQISELVKSNGSAVSDTQKSLVEQLKALNDLPTDKAEALKAVVKMQEATQQLQDEKKRLAASCPSG